MTQHPATRLGEDSGEASGTKQEELTAPPLHSPSRPPFTSEAVWLKVGWACQGADALPSPDTPSCLLPAPLLEAPAAHPAGPVDGILSDLLEPSLGEAGRRYRADTGPGPLAHLGPHWTTLVLGEKAAAPSLSLSVTHWTPLAENLGSEEDKKGRRRFPCISSWNCPQLWSFPPPSSETLD